MWHSSRESVTKVVGMLCSTPAAKTTHSEYSVKLPPTITTFWSSPLGTVCEMASGTNLCISGSLMYYIAIWLSEMVSDFVVAIWIEMVPVRFSAYSGAMKDA